MNLTILLTISHLFISGVLYVVDELDYETRQDYSLTVRATDSISGVYAEVLVSVIVTDVNDSPPEFLSDFYNVSVSEAAPFGSFILKVTAKDRDTGKKQLRCFKLCSCYACIKKKKKKISVV